jgi:hypothetical protein
MKMGEQENEKPASQERGTRVWDPVKVNVHPIDKNIGVPRLAQRSLSTFLFK